MVDVDLLLIVGEEHYPEWANLPYKIFYRHNHPYGVVATAFNYVAATTTDPELPFTRGMLRYIVGLHKKQDIIVITDHPKYIDKIKAFLSKHFDNITFSIKDGVLYSYINKKERTDVRYKKKG